MSQALALATALECIEAAGLAADGRERRELLDLAAKHVRSVLADFTPVMPVAPREELRKSSAHLRAVGAALAEGREAAGLTPPKGTRPASGSRPVPPPIPRRTPPDAPTGGGPGWPRSGPR